ncbi:MAG: transglutaminase domain-containing protein [Roseburia sp.]|nr:transglutaminase domain-containing protein [Roseburia sp.]
MKKHSVKRVLAGCLALLMLVNSASEVWATGLSEETTEVVEVTESTETTETVEGTELTEPTETTEDTEITEGTEAAESIEENEPTDLEEEIQIEETVAASAEAAVENLTYSFVDMDGNSVSTANTTENTVKLVVFDVNSTSSYTPAAALDKPDWSSVASNQIEFIWLCYNGTTAENFATDCMYINSKFNDIKNYGTDKNKEILARVSVCLNGENLTETEGSLIEEAFLAYWDKVGWTEDERNEKLDTPDEEMGGHFPVVFMINDANEIVEIYQYHDEKEYDFFDSIIADIANYVEKETTCDLPAVDDLAVEYEEYGGATLAWTYSLPDEVYGFKAYRSEDGGLTYTEAGTYYYEYDGVYGMGVDVPLDQATGVNKSCTYKVVPLNIDGAEGAAATVTNVGGNETNDVEGTAYNGIYFVDENGEKIDALSLHVGEAKKIGLAYDGEDGSQVLLTKTPFTVNGMSYEKGYNFQIAWWLKKATGEVSERNLSMITDYESSAVDWLFTEEVIQLKEGYFKANALAGENEKYFIEVRVDGPYAEEYFCARLPITIEAAEEGMTYVQPEALVPVTTQEEAYQSMRELMVERDSLNMVVTVDGLFDNSSTETWFDIDEVYDMYGEREGMKPEEGDYLHFTIGDPVETSFIYTAYECYSLNFKGEYYDMYQYGMPFITTRAQEDEVDAKIDELVHTESGALYEGKYSTDEAKVKAIYNYIVANVSGTVPGDRTTPIYHTAYHALMKGSGTCQAFALLFTRLSREMGIPSKIIMGTDANAHTYNIVELEGKWYYIDTSAGIYLSDANSFVRTNEQEHYQDERYIANYLNKVSETPYGYTPGATLTYTDTDETVVSMELADFSAAVAKINSLKTKRDYTITLSQGYSAGTITMPNKNYVNTLTIEGIDTNVELHHLGNITLTSPTVLRNITIKRNSSDGKTTGFAIGDYSLTIDGIVFLTTPVNLSGGKNSSVNVTERGQLYLVGGSLNIGTLNNNGGVFLSGSAHACSAKITNANLNNGRLRSEGTIQIVNLNLEGDATVEATRDFKITGKVVCATDNATLYTRLNEKNVPYLGVTGTVELAEKSNKIKVGVYATEENKLAKLDAGTQLLTVKNATADMFVPVADNVGGTEMYPAEDGYFLQKNKTGIYVYYADSVKAVLCRGRVESGDLAAAEVVGYFMSFAEAVTAVEERTDGTAEYTIVLMADVNSESAPAALKLPSKAKNIIITSAVGKTFDIFYTGNIALKAGTEFVNVRFNPMNAKKQGVASNISAGKYHLTLRNIELGTAPGMALKDISGSTGQTMTFATAGLTITGNISNSKEVIVEQSLTVKGNVKATAVTIENGKAENAADKNKLVVGGTLTATNLELQGYAVLDVAGAMALTNIYNQQTENITGTQVNEIHYNRNAKGAPNLTVKGVISGSNTTPVALYYDMADAGISDCVLTLNGVKYTLSDKQKLATLEKAALSQVAFYLNGTALESQGAVKAVKANKGVYVIDAASANSVRLESNKDGVKTGTDCLDYTQAVNEMNNRADAAADYIIHVGVLDATKVESDVTDTNLTDGKAISPITMPKKGVAASVTITSDQKESLTYSGNISYAGNLVIHNVTLSPEKDSNLSGTKNVTTVTLVDATATFKNISNVAVLNLEEADLLTTGTVAVTDVVLVGTAHWNALAKTTITNLDASNSGIGSYIASKQTAKTLVPMFTISGKVTLNANNAPVAVKVLTPEASAGNLKEVAIYAGVSLVVAPKEGAGKFMAYPFTDADTTNNEDIDAANLISYKTIKNEVASGDKSKMVVRIVEMKGDVIVAETYAQSFDEAVTIINNQGDLKASYRMELLQGSEREPIFTTKNGTTLGKLTLPKNAGKVTIVGANGDTEVMLAYTGSLGINCDTAFDNIILCETTSKEDTNTIAYSGAYELTVSDTVLTYAGDQLYLTSLKISKGTLNLESATVSVLGDMTAKAVKFSGESTLAAGGKATITDITGSEDGILMLVHLFNTKNATQLTINGEITDANIALVPLLYNVATEEYDFASESNITDKMIVTMPKASITDIALCVVDDAEEVQVLSGNLYKKNGGLYYTAEEPVVEVVAEDGKGTVVYGSRFLEWEQAVKEIDKRAQNGLTYSMILKDHIGGTAGNEAPIKTLTLPAKAKQVIVTSEEGELNHIFFQGNKVALKTNTTFENVGLFAIKKASKTGSAYGTIPYSFTAGNYELSIENLQYVESEAIYNNISAITGSTKGTLKLVLGTVEDNNQLAAEKVSGFGTVHIYNAEDTAVEGSQVQSVLLVDNSMSGIGTLNIYPGAIVSGGTVSVKNVRICGGYIFAKDITVSQTAYLDNAVMEAGSSALNDGKLKLKDIVVEEANNYLSAKLDKKGKTQLSISGTVTATADYTGDGEAITVGLYKNDYSGYVQLYNGMGFINAAKAEAFWFVPDYTVYDAVNDEEIAGMGYAQTGYGLYKSGKEIRYGAF